MIRHLLSFHERYSVLTALSPRQIPNIPPWRTEIERF
jgi:hypothetical protein